MGTRTINAEPPGAPHHRCPFCALEDASCAQIGEHWRVYLDDAPVRRGTTTLIPKRHLPTSADLTAEESAELLTLTAAAAARIERDLAPLGVIRSAHDADLDPFFAQHPELRHLHHFTFNIIPRLASGDDIATSEPFALDENPAGPLPLPIRFQAAKRYLPQSPAAASPFPGLTLMGVRITVRDP